MIKTTLSNLINLFSYSNIISNGNFDNTTSWLTSNATISASNNILTVTGTGGSASAYTYKDTQTVCENNKKIFMGIKVKVTNSNCLSVTLRGVGTTGGTLTIFSTLNTPVNGNEYLIGDILTTPSNFTGNYRLRIYQTYVDAATASGKVMQLKEAIAIDLTSLYGAGNEPSAADCLNIFRFVDGTKQPNFSKQIAI